MTTAERPRNHGWLPLIAILAVLVAGTGIAFAVVHARSGSGATSSSKDCNSPSLSAEVDLRPAVRTDQPDKLEQDVKILKQRLSAYGCSTVKVDGDRLHVSTTADGLAHLDALSAPGVLQFREVLEATSTSGSCLPVNVAAPADAELSSCSQNGSEQFRLGPAKVVGSDIKGATAQHDQQLGQWQIIVHFTKDGQQRWTALTRQTVGKRVAMVLDGVVISAPTIQEQIDGDAQITGSFTETTAKALATTLEHGALPVPLTRA